MSLRGLTGWNLVSLRGDYCLVAENGEDDENYAYLGTNELIITNGKNLFDGRILG